MDKKLINITLGTAGHIDHGKTALIKLLTGCDTDRLKIEKERGMTIELGFAPCTISALEVGIVDVPGHENFIKTMVAGATGIDAVIFVIAADDGVMPQTREHLDILTLLGVKNGVVALTKTDCVDEERLQNVTAEIRNFLAGTFLENAPILPISSITGKGFNEFYSALEKLISITKPKPADGVFRLPVERVFTLKGYGTVLSGIPVSGSIKTGDEAVILPQGLKGKIRAMRVYQHNSDIAMCGQCAALNIPQWDHKKIHRGNVVTIGRYFSPRLLYLCKFRLLDSAKVTLKNGSQVKFHTGTSQVTANIFLMEASHLSAGCESLIQVKLSEPVVAGPCDRFIVRTLSPANTVGGGIIIEALECKLNKKNPEVLEDIKKRAQAVLDNQDFVEYSVKQADNFAADENQISLRTKQPPEILKKILNRLIEEGKIVNLSGAVYIHKDNILKLENLLTETLREFHENRPESPGITLRQFLEQSSLPKEVFDGMIKLLTGQGKLIERKGYLALPEHKEQFSEEEQKLLREVESLFINNLFQPPKLNEIVEHTGVDAEKIRKILRILNEQQKLVKVEIELLFHSRAIEKAGQILTDYIKKEGKLESVKFKYLLDTSRKFAIPLLDYFDRIGLTRQDSHTRYLK